MNLLETNLWLALSLSKHSHHDAAKAWLDGEVTPDSVVFCRATQQTFQIIVNQEHVL